jgi:putative protein kinase ArgK-like GTPase of G3E family
MSAATEFGLDNVEETIRKFHNTMCMSGQLPAKRANQRENWLHSQFRRQLIDLAEKNGLVKLKLAEIRDKVRDNDVTPAYAASMLVDEFIKDTNKLA